MEALKQINRVLENHFVGQWAYRPLAKSDVFPLFEATRNPGFNQHLLWSAPETIEELSTQVQLLIREHTTSRSAALSICEKITGKWAGFIKYAPYLDTISMSFWVHPDFWKSTLAFSTTRFALDTVFNETDIPHIFAYVALANTPMQRMCEKSGYVYEGIVQLPHSDGQPRDMKLYKLIKADWEAVKNRSIGEFY